MLQSIAPSSGTLMIPWLRYGVTSPVSMFWVPPTEMPGPPACGEQLSVIPRYMERPPLPSGFMLSRSMVTT
ncbi:hypothetical protein H3H54_14395 [Brachybacterium sp. Z12]|uniref:hypothetical protein n=1 Tax=Brachybacterium sp. Z12 TaxID=2759167 RepID=UPI001862EFA2|nr:hypothetical protein [Brachybacterium sp. Z12]QNN82248.1 hypothetical protein H3H54_14395 [Brachybacterium sp. Z12]